MPDIGGMELLVIGIVALIVVGPKDLPKMFKKLGQMVARVRAMGREFTSAMNAAADDTGMTEMTKDLRAASKFTSPKSMAKDFMGDVMDDIDPSKYEEGSATRIIAEKKATAQKDAKELAAKAREIRAAKAAKAAELSGEPEDDAPEVPADPGPANVEVTEAAAPSDTPAPQSDTPETPAPQGDTPKTPAPQAERT